MCFGINQTFKWLVRKRRNYIDSAGEGEHINTYLEVRSERLITPNNLKARRIFSQMNG